MPKLQRQVGSTGQMMLVNVLDTSSTVGGGKTGILFNAVGLTAYYKRNTGTASVSITLATITTLGTYATGGFKEVDGTNMAGCYEFHVPNAALASGADNVVIYLQGAAGMAPVKIEIELTATSNQDATAGGISRIDAAVSSRSTYAGADTAGTTTLLSRVSGTRATNLDNLDATVSSRSTFNAGSTSVSLTAGAVQAIWDALASALVTSGSIGAWIVGKLDAAISTRSTYAGADTSGTTTLLSRLSGTRATNLDNLDATISSRSTYSGADTAGTTTLLSRLTGTRASNLDFLNQALPANFSLLSIDGTGRVTYAPGEAAVRKNQALLNFEFLLLSSTDHVTPKTGLGSAVIAEHSIDGAAFGACLGAVAEVGNGMYRIDLANTELNGDVITFYFSGTGADPRFVTILTQP